MAKRLTDPMNVRLSPQMRNRLEELAAERAESMAVLIRDALELTYGPQPSQRAPEPFPMGSNLRAPPRGPGFMS
jgi:hypothetical protein